MGRAVAPVGLQVGRQALTDSPLIARVVPDVSGIDKQFDYSIPPPLGPRVRPGAVVRVELNGRRVDAWVTAVGSHGDDGFGSVPADRLSPLLDVADLGVEESVVPLCEWVAREWSGPLRNVLSSATPARKRSRGAHPRHGTAPGVDNAVSRAVAGAWGGTGAVLRVPPLVSALDAVVACAGRGPVLVVCPTQRMARLGAAALRRRGLTTAELPDQPEAACAGVDVVIGARSAVLGPCAGMASVVVIDEHEESLHEERVPTWSAPAVAVERARRAGVPVFLVSPVPSALSEAMLGPAVLVDDGTSGWPEVRVVDLNVVPVRGSLLSAALLDAVSDPSGSVLCILNAKGGARLVACKSCRALQSCGSCRSAVGETDGMFVCGACGTRRLAVCDGCGRTAFVAVRSGTTRITGELQAAARLPVVEVTSSTAGTRRPSTGNAVVSPETDSSGPSSGRRSLADEVTALGGMAGGAWGRRRATQLVAAGHSTLP